MSAVKVPSVPDSDGGDDNDGDDNDGGDNDGDDNDGEMSLLLLVVVMVFVSVPPASLSARPP